ncbi:MAG: MarR family transcriptional regulator [Abditibacteriaceae bacterium]
MQLKKSDYITLANFRNSLRRFLHETSEAAREHGVTPQQHQVLLAIKGAQNRNWLSIGELAEAMQVRHHSMVALVDRCQNAELVQRDKAKTDRRIAQVSLTPKGEKIIENLSFENKQELNRLRTAMQIHFEE